MDIETVLMFMELVGKNEVAKFILNQQIVINALNINNESLVSVFHAHRDNVSINTELQDLKSEIAIIAQRFQGFNNCPDGGFCDLQEHIDKLCQLSL